MDFQITVKSNATNHQPILKRYHEKRITYEDSMTTIEDVVVTKIIKKKPDATLYFHELELYFQ